MKLLSEEERKQTSNLPAVILFLILLICLSVSLGFNYISTDLQESTSMTENSTTVLQVAHWINIPDDLIHEFERENPLISIQYHQYHQDMYERTMNNLIDSDRTPDILGVPHGYLRQWISAGVLYDLKNGILANPYQSNVREKTQEMCVVNEYVLSLGSTYMGLWYREDILHSLNLDPPIDYASLLQVCSVLKEAGYTPLTVGGANGGFLTTLFCTGTTQEHLQFPNYKPSPLFDQEYLALSSAELSIQEVFDQLLQGDIAMAALPGPSPWVIEQTYPNVNVVPVYLADGKSPCLIADYLIGIYANTDKYSASMKFVNFLSKKDVAERLAVANNWFPTISASNFRSLPYADQWYAIRTASNFDCAIYTQDVVYTQMLTKSIQSRLWEYSEQKTP